MSSQGSLFAADEIDPLRAREQGILDRAPAILARLGWTQCSNGSWAPPDDMAADGRMSPYQTRRARRAGAERIQTSEGRMTKQAYWRARAEYWRGQERAFNAAAARADADNKTGAADAARKNARHCAARAARAESNATDNEGTT